MGEAERRKKLEERSSKKRKNQKKENADARKGRKIANYCAMICGSGGSKSRFANAAGAEPAGQIKDEKLHAVVV
jgi:hypothetical protein